MNDLSRGTVLIVDDQPNWRLLLSALLKVEDVSVSLAGDFHEATDALDRSSFNVVVLDLRLVDQDAFNVEGLGLLRLIRKRHPGTRVIMLTGYPESLVGAEIRADVEIPKSTASGAFDPLKFRKTVMAEVAVSLA